jgi:hypothetical protein
MIIPYVCHVFLQSIWIGVCRPACLSLTAPNGRTVMGWKGCGQMQSCYVKLKVKVTLEQAMKAQRGSRGIALLFP